MIALKENGQWSRVTLRELKRRFPIVSFRKTIESEGQSWDYDDEIFEAVLVIEATAPEPNSGGSVVAGPLEDFNGEPLQTWIVKPAPEPSTDPREYELSAAQFEYLLVDSELDDALEAAIVSTKSARKNSKGDKEAEAQFRMALKGRSFGFDKTLAMIGALAAHVPVGVTIDETTLTPFWLRAAAQK